MQDPDTALNEWWLRHQIKLGLIPCHRAGKRFLVDLDALERYLSAPPELQEVTIPVKNEVLKMYSR
jgi:hypothetical protein